MSGFSPAQMGAKLGLAGVLVYKDAAGNVIKEVPFTGAVPLAELGLSVEDAQQLIQQQEQSHGTHDHG